MPKKQYTIWFTTLTGEEVELDPDDICEIAYLDKKIIKRARDLNKGDVILNIVFRLKTKEARILR